MGWFAVDQSAYLSKAGGTMTGNISLGGNQITDVAKPGQKSLLITELLMLIQIILTITHQRMLMLDVKIIIR